MTAVAWNNAIQLTASARHGHLIILSKQERGCSNCVAIYRRSLLDSHVTTELHPHNWDVVTLLWLIPSRRFHDRARCCNLEVEIISLDYLLEILSVYSL